MSAEQLLPAPSACSGTGTVARLGARARSGPGELLLGQGCWVRAVVGGPGEAPEGVTTGMLSIYGRVGL